MYSSGKNYSRAEILEAFHGSDHTPTTREVSDAIKSGKLIVVFDATMESAGAASSGNLIHVNPTQEIYDVLSTLTHEGRHALDMSAKLIPLPTSLLGRSHEMIAFAELRAFAAASDFAVLNNFTEAGAFGNAEKHPFQVADAIATGYGLVIDDLRLREIVEKALSGDWR